MLREYNICHYITYIILYTSYSVIVLFLISSSDVPLICTSIVCRYAVCVVYNIHKYSELPIRAILSADRESENYTIR